MKRCASCGVEYEDAALFCRADGTPLAHEGPPGDPYIGKLLLGQFAVEALLGEGGMGTVYRAHQTGVDRKVALKVLRSDVTSIPGVVERFHREGRLASRISSLHVAHVYLTGTLPDGNPILAMEYLEGRGLDTLLREGQALPIPRALHILRQIGEAVAEAHENGIVHRDLKPENVMLIRAGADDDFVKVLDFGIAKQVGAGVSLTGAGMTLGTPRYMSPEAAAGDEIGPAADVYALGVILYEALAGHIPFDGQSPAALLVQHLQEEPKRLSSNPLAHDTPPALEAFIHRCLAKKPDLRPRDGRTFLVALDEATRDLAGAPARASGAGDAGHEAEARRAVSAEATTAEHRVTGQGSAARASARPSTPIAAEVAPAPDDAPMRVAGKRRTWTWIAGALFGAAIALAVGAFWPSKPTPDELRVADMERRAQQAFDTGSYDGAGGAIALTELLLTLRADHPAALDLRRRMLRQLLTEARDAEREGRLATAIDRLELAARLAPEDTTLVPRRHQLDAQLHAGEPTAPAPTPPPPSPPPDVVAGAATRAVRVTIEPDVPRAGQIASLRALVRGFESDLERSHFHVRALVTSTRMTPAVVDATKAGDDVYGATFTFPVAGRYSVGFASHERGGRHIEGAVQVRVAGGTAAPTPTPTPTQPDPTPSPTEPPATTDPPPVPTTDPIPEPTDPTPPPPTDPPPTPTDPTSPPPP